MSTAHAVAFSVPPPPTAVPAARAAHPCGRSRVARVGAPRSERRTRHRENSRCRRRSCCLPSRPRCVALAAAVPRRPPPPDCGDTEPSATVYATETNNSANRQHARPPRRDSGATPASTAVAAAAAATAEPLPRHKSLDNWGGLGGAYDTKTYPAKDLCSHCGLCDTRYITYVKDACSFINQQFTPLEEEVHGRARDLDSPDDVYFGVHREMVAARRVDPLPGAQWTGIVSTLAIEMLEAGMVDGVVCVQSSEHDRFEPRPIVARTRDDILAARVNKPTLSPNLSVLDTVERSGLRRLLFIGVGCQVQALRAVQHKIGLEKLYVLGTPCVDNVTRVGLDKFLNATSASPSTVVYYEFMQDFRVHFKHDNAVIGGAGDKWEETVPFFGLKTDRLKDVFAPSCLSCFDYVNSLADLVVGYMGAPLGWQWMVARNDDGAEMLSLARRCGMLEEQPVTSRGDRRQAVQQSIPAYDAAVTLPMWAAELMGAVIDKIGPRGLEYARFSIDSHFTRNYLYVRRNYPEKLEGHVPAFAKRIVDQYKLPKK